MSKDLLNSNSIEEHLLKIKDKRNNENKVSSEVTAYVLKNMGFIKELIKLKEIDNDLESVLKYIKQKDRLHIIQTDEIVKIFAKNGIRSESYKENRKACVSIFIFLFVIYFAFLGLPLMFASYEVSIIKTVGLISFILFVLFCCAASSD